MNTVEPRRKRLSLLTHPEKCTGCLICELRCSWRFAKAFLPSRAAIRIHRPAEGESAFSMAFTELCDQCGICARFCPYGALDMAG